MESGLRNDGVILGQGSREAGNGIMVGATSRPYTSILAMVFSPSSRVGSCHSLIVHYDRIIYDRFASQDYTTENIVVALQVETV